MNEQIRKLIEQATTKQDFYPAGCNGYPDYRYEFDKEKFAELIVRECFKIVDDFAVEQAGAEEESFMGENLLLSMKITDAAWKIKEHFGVKE